MAWRVRFGTGCYTRTAAFEENDRCCPCEHLRAWSSVGAGACHMIPIPVSLRRHYSSSARHPLQADPSCAFWILVAYSGGRGCEAAQSLLLFLNRCGFDAHRAQGQQGRWKHLDRRSLHDSRRILDLWTAWGWWRCCEDEVSWVEDVMKDAAR